MKRTIKRGDWLVMEDSDTGEKTFALPASRLRPYPETKNARQNLPEAQGQCEDESLGDRTNRPAGI